MRSAGARHTVLVARALVVFPVAVLKMQMDIVPETLGFIEHPGISGALPNSKTLGTMSKFESVTDLLVTSGVHAWALAQRLYGARSRKTTHVIGRVPNFGAILSLGATQFDQRGVYIAPLVRGATDGATTVGRGVRRDFETPPALAEALADMTVKADVGVGSKALEAQQHDRRVVL